jgi:CheY-like chemotaxis protein
LARKILLADDSVTAQNMGRKILADAGYDVVTVNNGSAALKRITEIKPDLIVLDVYMPGYSGLEVCQRLKDSEETAHIPVLLTVGKLEPFKPEEARRVRADAHIVKPFEASELLTAITRLEDRIVPKQPAGSRFGAEGSRKADYNPGADNGWKSRLGFPSKKKKDEKEEDEAEDFTAGGGFRDFRKGKSKSGAGVTVAKTAGAEPSLVPDLPRDITPQELDALSALAAQLDRPVPANEVVTAKAETEVARADTDKGNASGNEAKAEVGTPTVEPAAVGVEAPVFAVEIGAAVEIPVEHVETVVEGAAGVTDAVAVETRPAETQYPENQQPENQPAETQHSEIRHTENQGPETQHSETPAAAVAVEVSVEVNSEVNTALLTQEIAPVDRNDEPGFATAAGAVEQASEETGPKLAEAVAVTQSETPETADAVAASVQEMVAAEEPAPSDEELAEALRLLTPATVQPDVSSSQSTIPSSEGLAAAGQLLAEEVARSAGAGSRWVAEPVALSREEAALSLEAEMFRTFAATPGGEIGPATMTGVSAIAVAVENRLAAVGLEANALPEAGAELRSPEHVSSENSSGQHSSAEPGCAEQVAEQHGAEIVSAETSAAEASAETFSHQPSAISHSPIEVQKIAPEQLAAEAKDSPTAIPEEAPAEEIAAATFADMIGQNVIGQNMDGQSMGQDGVDQNGVDRNKVGEGASAAAVEESGESVGGTTAAVGPELAEESRDSSSEVEGQEAMGKEVKSKSGKSNWHQIHSAPASAAAKGDVVEAAKEVEVVAEEAPKAMAAAAASTPTSVPDASTIASIVDSVMADLRPKIVEEIAKKLAGK